MSNANYYVATGEADAEYLEIWSSAKINLSDLFGVLSG